MITYKVVYGLINSAIREEWLTLTFIIISAILSLTATILWPFVQDYLGDHYQKDTPFSILLKQR